MSKKNRNYFGSKNVQNEEFQNEEIVEETEVDSVEDDAQNEEIIEDTSSEEEVVDTDVDVVEDTNAQNEEIIEDTPQEVVEEDNAQNEEIIEDVFSEEKVTIGTVNCSKLNVRELPSLTSEVKTVLNMNDTVTIIDESNPLFYKVTYGENNETIGYVKKEFINK